MAEKFNPLGLISATRTEFAVLSQLLSESGFELSGSKEKPGLSWIMGEFHGRQTLLVRGGMGKISAAMSTQFLIDNFQPQLIVNLGVAGSLNSELKPGSVLVADSCQEWDFDLSALYLQALAPNLPKLNISLSPILSVLVSRVFTGRIITGDTFVADKKRRSVLAKKFSAVAVDMESAAIAKVALLNRIPFLVVKGITDQADGSAVVSLNNNLRQATTDSFNVLKEILDKNLV